jgi:hypothetical protein
MQSFENRACPMVGSALMYFPALSRMPCLIILTTLSSPNDLDSVQKRSLAQA